MIHCDNQSCVKLSKNLMLHDRSKHINITYHYISNKVQKSRVRRKYISIDGQTFNVLTKSLSRDKFMYLIGKLGIMDITPLAERES